MPCSAKIAKKKESSAHSHDKGLSGNTLLASLSVKIGVIAKDAFSTRSDHPIIRAIPAPSSNISSLPASSSAIMVPRCKNISPSTSVSVSVSLDETMSTCDSLKSPEFVYIDKEDYSAVKSIERRTCSSLNISDCAQGKGFSFYCAQGKGFSFLRDIYAQSNLIILLLFNSYVICSLASVGHCFLPFYKLKTADQ